MNIRERTNVTMSRGVKDMGMATKEVRLRLNAWWTGELKEAIEGRRAHEELLQRNVAK